MSFRPKNSESYVFNEHENFIFCALKMRAIDGGIFEILIRTF